MSTPAWALALRDEVAAQEAIAPPELTWRKRGDSGISGRYYVNDHRIVMSVGKGQDRVSQRTYLLHELAHAVAPKDEHHGPVFYDIAWRLFLQYKLPIRRTLMSEGRYKAEALIGARRAGVKVSEAVAAKADAKRRRRDGHTCKPKPRSRAKMLRYNQWYRPCYACDLWIPTEGETR